MKNVSNVGDDKTDKRITKTKRRIKDSLVELMQETSLDKITVKDLCERAEINRNTFYYHYQTIQELFDEITDKFIDEIIAATQGGSDIYWYFRAMCDVYVKNHDLVSAVLAKHLNVKFYFRYCDVATEIFETEVAKLNPLLDSEILRMLSVYHIHSSIGLLSTWVAQGMKRDPDEIATLLTDLLQNGSLIATIRFRPKGSATEGGEPIFTNVQQILRETFDK